MDEAMCYIRSMKRKIEPDIQTDPAGNVMTGKAARKRMAQTVAKPTVWPARKPAIKSVANVAKPAMNAAMNPAIKQAALAADKPSRHAAKGAVPSRAIDPQNDDSRLIRQRAVKDLKRQMILDAARRVFEKEGLLGANMRAIAGEAGYTASALYNHYASKEEIYGDLLSQSLDRLHDAVRNAAPSDLPPARRIEHTALAFYDFYLHHPRELDLGFYLFQGMKPLGLTPELNEQLNQRLRQALDGVESGLRALGCSAAAARQETTSVFGHCVGLLLLTHTGRIRMFGQDGRALFTTYLHKLLQQVT
jgi:AcrR family transcriptional regulator